MAVLGTPKSRRENFWTPDEDGIVRAYYPQYVAMAANLPGRTEEACRCRASNLKITKPKHSWTGAEEVLLRKLFPTVHTKDLFCHFPHVSERAVRLKAKGLGLRRPKSRQLQKITGNRLIDEIRARARNLHYTMYELDLECKTGRYFAGYCFTRGFNARAVFKAIDLLQGQIDLTWKA